MTEKLYGVETHIVAIEDSSIVRAADARTSFARRIALSLQAVQIFDAILNYRNTGQLPILGVTIRWGNLGTALEFGSSTAGNTNGSWASVFGVDFHDLGDNFLSEVSRLARRLYIVLT